MCRIHWVNGSILLLDRFLSTKASFTVRYIYFSQHNGSLTMFSYLPHNTFVSSFCSECLFRQLCAIHWLLEALTLESSSSMHSILSCWKLTYVCNSQ